MFKWKEELPFSHFKSKPRNYPFSEEGMLKAEVGWKLGFLCQLAKLCIKRTSSWRSLRVLLQGTHKGVKAKQPIAYAEKVLVVLLDQTSHNTPLNQNLIQTKALIIFNYLKAETWTNTCTLMLIAGCTSPDCGSWSEQDSQSPKDGSTKVDRINKMRFVHSIECYRALKRREILTHTPAWWTLKIVC